MRPQDVHAGVVLRLFSSVFVMGRLVCGGCLEPRVLHARRGVASHKTQHNRRTFLPNQTNQQTNKENHAHLRVVGHVLPAERGGALHQIHVRDEVALALVQVDGAVVQLVRFIWGFGG